MIINQQRIFADSYQFYVFDSSCNHYKELSWENNTKLKYDYIASDSAIYVSTVSDLNDHRLRVYTNEEPVDCKYQRVFKRQININSGKLIISSPSCSEDEEIIIKLKKGTYSISICSNSIGKDLFSYGEKYQEEMSEDEYLMHDCFEYYDIYIQ